MVSSGAIRPARAPALDGHVANRHPAFHGQGPDRLAGKFNDAAGTAGGADFANDREDHVLRRHAQGQFPIDGDAHVLRFALDHRLGGEHVLDLGRTDSERE